MGAPTSTQKLTVRATSALPVPNIHSAPPKSPAIACATASVKASGMMTASKAIVKPKGPSAMRMTVHNATRHARSSVSTARLQRTGADADSPP